MKIIGCLYTRNQDANKFSSDLYDSYIEYMKDRNKDTYLNMVDKLSSLFFNCYLDLHDLIECQIKNPYLTRTGFQYLIKLLEYTNKVAIEDSIMYNSKNIYKEYENTFAGYASLKNFHGSCSNDLEEFERVVSFRSITVENLKRYMRENKVSGERMITSFLAPMVNNEDLTRDFVKLFFIYEFIDE